MPPAPRRGGSRTSSRSNTPLSRTNSRSSAPARRPTSSTPPVILAWTSAIKQALSQKRPRLLHDLLTLKLVQLVSKKPYPALRKEARELGDRFAIETVIDQEMGDDWKSLNSMLVAYLWFLESADPNMIMRKRPSYKEETMTYFSRMVEYLKAFNSAFNHPDGAILSFTATLMAKWACLTAVAVDQLLGDPHMKASKDLVNPLLRTFNIALSGERTPYTSPNQTLKKAALVDLGNCLFRLYYKLNETSMIPTLQDHITAGQLPLSYPYFRNPTLCTFFYYRGISLLRSCAFISAHQALQDAYSICHPGYISHRRKILIPLLASSILSGLFPRPELFNRPESPDLAELFLPLCYAIQKGDFRAFRHAMGIEGPARWKYTWWEENRLLHILEGRANILLWRSLIRKIWLLTCSPQQKQQIVRIDDILACAVALHRKEPHDIGPAPSSDPHGVADPASWWFQDSGGLRLDRIQVEGIVLSLVDQKLIRGYMLRQSGGQSTWLVLSKTGNPFPSLYQTLLARQPVPGASASRQLAGGGRVVRMNGVKEIGQ
ncbi:hypothetical protein FN846DRAFT_926467 [Sphaerosporella brunnea]|uniref:PCI domain-containing protein n=1 Tax=Sphaerosporella brunnea TaxID=1250544 RepID=A0A5J5FB79_9PEZI|nr:hypothetical protein FN846DRAFT_926467 [Sphaerosporella brunnea]